MRKNNIKLIKEDVKGLFKLGELDWKDNILPSSLDFRNPEYFCMDGYFYSGVIVVDYPKGTNSNWITTLLNIDFNVDLSVFYEKLDSSKVIREITYHIGDMGGVLKTVNQNQQDIDIIKSSYEDAKYIRKQLQVNKEELYYLCMYFLVYADNLEELKFNLERLEGICASIGLKTRRGLFRQEQIFNTMLPILKNDKDIKESSARNVLTETLSSTYPFISSEIFDDEGILIGENSQNKSLVIIDRFNSSKYKNSNMCVLGTSGAGKSFFVKLMILRNRYLGISQFVIDPEGEYFKVCKSLNGTYIRIGSKSNTFINIMDIRENDFSDDKENGGYLSEKINKLKAFFSLVFTDITKDEEVLLEEKLIECYENKGITFNDLSLFEEENGTINIKRKFKSTNKMPTLEDLYNLLINDDKTYKLGALLKPYVNGSLSFFNNYTNVDLRNKLIVTDISGLEETSIPLGMYLVIEIYWDRIRQNRSEKKIIYMDEIWRLIGSSASLYTAEFVYKIFKTIRKFGGGATAITQDISDFFAFDEGKYGKAVINNSALKFILQLEEEDMKVLSEVISLSEEEIVKIKTFSRGNGLLFADKNHIALKVEANAEEYKLITTDRRDLE